MKDKGILILIYSAIGGLAGVLLANYFQMFPWVGLLSGALIGVFAYNPREIWNAIPRAYSEAKSKLPGITKEVVEFFTFVVKLTIPLSCIAYAVYAQVTAIKFLGLVGGDMEAFSAVIVIVTFYLAGMSFSNFYFGKKKKLSETAMIRILLFSWFFWFSEGSSWRMSILCIFFPLLTLVAQLCLIGGCIKYVYDCRYFIAQFLKTFALLIYSQARLIIFMGGLLGGSIGFYGFSGNVFYGMLFGALCGGISYWIIAIKWLKLKPAF